MRFLKRNYITLIIGTVSLAGLYLVSLYSYVLYHVLVELFTVVIAFGIFLIAWNSKKFLDNHYLLFVGIAYFFIGAIDLFHTLSYEGMGIFSGFAESNLATQLWISGRYMESISLLVAFLFITRKLNHKVQLMVYSVATVLIMLSVYYWQVFPDCFVEGSGLTPFKVGSEYVISALLGLGIVFLFLYRKEFNKTVMRLIAASMVITIFSELSFTLYTDVYGLFNQLGHFLKVISFFLIYKAIIETGFSQPINLLFFKLKQREEELQESEEKFRSLYFSMNEAVCLQEMINDEQGKPIDYRILDVNRAFESIMGLKREKVIQKRASKIFNSEIAPYIGAYSRVLDTGKPEKFEAYFPQIDKYFLISVFTPSKGKFATIFSDITTRKKFEMEIEALSRFTLENPNPVMRMDEKNSIIYANGPAKKILDQLNEERKEGLLQYLQDSAQDPKGGKPSTAQAKIGKSVYEFTVVPVESSGYANIYGTDITSRKKAESLEKKMAEQKTMAKERNKLARDLHDTVSQTLFAAKMIAETVSKVWKKDTRQGFKKLEEIKRLHDIAFKEMRILLYELKPSALKDEDLESLLNRLVRSLEARSKSPIGLTVKGKHRFPAKVQLGFYRIAQEAVNNIIKHSDASNISILVHAFPDRLHMEITDDGRGFDSAKISPTNLGLKIMEERAQNIGALLEIDSREGGGTRVSVVYEKRGKSQTG